MEKGELNSTDGRDQGDNVVRFPKDWIGPLEDLVPIGARAQAQRSDHDDVPPPTEASDFWGESAAAVHEAVAEPGPRPRTGQARRAQPAHRVSRQRIAATGAGATVAALAVFVVLHFDTETGAAHHAAADHHSPAVTRLTADELDLRQSGGTARHAGMAAEASDTARIERVQVRQLRLASQRALEAGVLLVSFSRHVSTTSGSAHTSPVTGPSSATPAAPEATAPASAAITTPAAPTTSDAGSSTADGSSSGPSSSGGTSSGASSGSTSKTYGYGGLLGAGHSGS